MRQPAPATGAVWSAQAIAGMNGTPTWSCGLLASVAGTALLFLAEQPANGGLDALLLGGFMQRVLATITAAGVAHGAVLRACGAWGQERIFNKCSAQHTIPLTRPRMLGTFNTPSDFPANT